MQYLKNIIIALTILLGLITFAQSETSWIKKKDKTETVKKVEEKKVDEKYHCLDKDVEDLLAYDKEMSKSSPIGPVMGGYEMGYGPKVYPYTSTNMMLDQVVKLN